MLWCWRKAPWQQVRSGKSSALVRMHYTFLPEARLALLSLGWFQEWRDRVGGSCGFTKTGFVRLVAPDKAPLLRQNVARLQGLASTPPSSAALSCAPSTAGRNARRGYCSLRARLWLCRRLCHSPGLHGRRAPGGAVLHQGVTVTGIQVHGDQIQGLQPAPGTSRRRW